MFLVGYMAMSNIRYNWYQLFHVSIKYIYQRVYAHQQWGRPGLFNTLRPWQNGRHFLANTFRHIFLNENVKISIESSLMFVAKGPIDNIPALVQIMAWCWPGYKPLSELMLVSLLTHICITRPQKIKTEHMSTTKGVDLFWDIVYK